MHILSDYNAVYNYSIVLTACQYIWQNFFDFFKILLISYKNMIYRQKRKNLPFGRCVKHRKRLMTGEVLQNIEYFKSIIIN